TEQLAGNGADQAVSPSRPRRCCCRTLSNPTGRNAAAEDDFCRNSARLGTIHGRGMRKMPHFSIVLHANGGGLRSNGQVWPRDRRGPHPCQSAAEVLTFSSQCRLAIAKQRRFT